MIIRATHKTLKLAGLKAPKKSPEEMIKMPGEWTAGVVSLGKPGKMAINLIDFQLPKQMILIKLRIYILSIPLELRILAVD